MDNVQKHNICTSVPSSQTFRSHLRLQCCVDWPILGLSDNAFLTKDSKTTVKKTDSDDIMFDWGLPWETG
jgi:hypothetical protein